MSRIRHNPSPTIPKGALGKQRSQHTTGDGTPIDGSTIKLPIGVQRGGGPARMLPPVGGRGPEATHTPSRTAEPGKKSAHHAASGGTRAPADRFSDSFEKPKAKHGKHHVPMAHASGDGTPIDGSITRSPTTTRTVTAQPITSVTTTTSNNTRRE